MSTLWHSLASSRRRRRSTLAASCLFTFLLLLTFYHSGWASQISSDLVTPAPDHKSTESQDSNLPLTQHQQASFWRSVYQIILNNDPQCQKPPEIVVPQNLDIAYQDDHVHSRPDILWMDEADIQRMKIAHANFISDVRSANIRLVYNKGTRGIITTVSDQRFPVLLTSLRMMREAECTLPVEVVLWQPSPYTDHICTSVFPALNAKCIYLSDIFVEAGTGVGIDSYQYKIFAILFSSFDELLFLDADAWPATNPDPLFTSQPFTDTGLVTWPDFWYPSESPYFFSIAKIQNPPALADRAATEAGALMYSKSKHEHGIMLATYYNYYGPKYYYPLQSQGAPGQGDKETFGLAAMALGESFYAVKQMVTALGRADSGGQWLGSAMVQYDPHVDFQHRQKVVSDAEKDAASSTSELTPVPTEELNYHDHNANSPPSIVDAAVSFANQSSFDPNRPKPLFVHANFPKFDPRTIFEESVNGAHTPTRDTNGTNVRCWEMTPEVAIERFGYDVEARFWSVIQKVACQDLIGSGVKGDESDNNKEQKEHEVCQQVEKYIREIFPDLMTTIGPED